MQTIDATSRMTADVVIVGFGPVGKLLAIQLGRQAWCCRRGPNEAGYPLPRAVTHGAEFARILQSIGLPPTSIPEITQPYDDMYVWKNQSGETLLKVDWSGHGSSGWNNTYFFNQPDLKDRLDQIVATLPTVQVRRGWLAIDPRGRSGRRQGDLLRMKKARWRRLSPPST